LSLTTKTPLKKPAKRFQPKSKPKPKFDTKNITCYKYSQKGHTSRLCRINTKLHELQLEEEVIHHIQNLLIEAFETESSTLDISEEPFY
jgi:hypothetical protein